MKWTLSLSTSRVPHISFYNCHPGSWGYSFYANNGNLNGNNQRDYYYPDQNYVYSAAVSNYPTFAGTLAARNPYFQTATVIAVSMEAPASLFELGITRCVFTGPRTGVAVGAFNLYQGYSNTFSATILLTLDGAESWLAATGIPQQQSATVLTTGVAQGTWGAPGAPTPWPVRSKVPWASAPQAAPARGSSARPVTPCAPPLAAYPRWYLTQSSSVFSHTLFWPSAEAFSFPLGCIRSRSLRAISPPPTLHRQPWAGCAFFLRASPRSPFPSQRLLSA